MKVFIILSVFVACACAEGLEGYAAPAIISKQVNINTGHSTQERKQDAGGAYAFAYDAAWQDGAWGSGAHSQRESGDAWGNKEGAYSLNIGDGRSRVVKYVADGAGFRASIKTNEPGIVASNPAAADINTPHGEIAHAPAVIATNVGGYSDGGLAVGASNLHGGALLGGAGLAGGYGGNGLGLAGGLNGAGLVGGYGGNGLGLAGGYGNGALLGGAGLAGGYGGNGLGLAGGYGHGAGLGLAGGYGNGALLGGAGY